jgi:WD40 repeat protein/serine/threonine protein kinase
MSTETRLRELLLQWEDLRHEGRDASAPELCRECPELAGELQRRIDALQSVNAFLDSDSPESTGTLSPPDAVQSATHNTSHFSSDPLTATAPARPEGSQNASRRSRSPGYELKSGAEPVPGYALVERLGKGGFGEVWKAEAPGGFPIALKFVPLADEGVNVELRALEIIKGIRHPNLLSTFGAWHLQGYLVIAMELGDRTLADRYEEAIAEGLPGIRREELLEYFQEAAKGIDFLNEPHRLADGKQRSGIQHRDIKPQNILLVGNGIKVADFGLARLLEHAVTGHTGSMTPAFAAPEFVKGQTSNRSDQYSLAVTYCQLRSGRVPFEGNLERVLLGHLAEAPDLSMLPEDEQLIIRRALAKNPVDRWPSCRALVEALATPPTKVRGHRPLIWVSLAAAAAFVAIAALVPIPEFGKNTGVDVVNQLGKAKQPEPEPEAAEKQAQIELAARRVGTVDDPITEEVTARTVPVLEPARVSTATSSAEKKSEVSTPSDVTEAPAIAPTAPVGELRRFTRHTGPVRSVAFFPGNQTALSGGDDGTVRLWDVGTGEERHRFEGHQGTVHCVALSPDGRTAISGGDDGIVRLWQIDSKSEGRTLRGHTASVYSVAFSHDGSRAISAGQDTTVRLWDFATGEERKQLEVSGGSIWSIAFTDDSHVLVASDSNVVGLFDITTGSKVQRFEGHKDVVWSVAYSPESRRAFTSSGSGQRDNTIRLWDIENGRELHRFEGHLGAIGSVACSPDGRRALSGSVDRTVRLWDVATAAELQRFEGHTDVVNCVVFTPDGHRALSASNDGTVRVWGLPK